MNEENRERERVYDVVSGWGENTSVTVWHNTSTMIMIIYFGEFKQVLYHLVIVYSLHTQMFLNDGQTDIFNISTLHQCTAVLSILFISVHFNFFCVPSLSTSVEMCFVHECLSRSHKVSHYSVTERPQGVPQICFCAFEDNDNETTDPERNMTSNNVPVLQIRCSLTKAQMLPISAVVSRFIYHRPYLLGLCLLFSDL